MQELDAPDNRPSVERDGSVRRETTGTRRWFDERSESKSQELDTPQQTEQSDGCRSASCRTGLGAGATSGASRKAQELDTPPTDPSEAGWTGLEPAASGVTGRRSNQLNYHPDVHLLPTVARALVVPASRGWWAIQDSNL